MTLEEFKENSSKLRDRILRRSDVIDFDNGSMTVYKENLNKYLEKYGCKDEYDLSETLWFSYGVYVKVVD